MLYHSDEMRFKILIIDDEIGMCVSLSKILSAQGYENIYTSDPTEVDRLLSAEDIDLIIMDVKMPGIDGISLLKSIKTRGSRIPIIMISGYASVENIVRAMKFGALNFYKKPIHIKELIAEIQRISEARCSENDGKTVHKIITQDPKIQKLLSIVEKVAVTDVPVVITGESGTGKELFAEVIHEMSPRREGPLIKINCAAIPETLLESELFGYEKGAFTGAMTRHAGLFEQANGSSLFLDEIGDLTLSTQAKLLRAIQEREIRRIGGSENIRLDVRIIAATNKKLEEEIAKGAFREDLYYRLNVIAFSVPPLRERVADIPLLVEHFLSRLNEVHSRKKTISNEALQILMKYRWPGNVRQLESVMERAYIMCEDDVVSADYMPEEVKQEKAKNLSSNFEIPDEGLSLEEIERELIKKALMKAEGKISHAAKYLNMSYDKLWFKVKKLREKGDPLDFTK